MQGQASRSGGGGGGSGSGSGGTGSSQSNPSSGIGTSVGSVGSRLFGRKKQHLGSTGSVGDTGPSLCIDGALANEHQQTNPKGQEGPTQVPTATVPAEPASTDTLASASSGATGSVPAAAGHRRSSSRSSVASSVADLRATYRRRSSSVETSGRSRRQPSESKGVGPHHPSPAPEQQALPQQPPVPAPPVPAPLLSFASGPAEPTLSGSTRPPVPAGQQETAPPSRPVLAAVTTSFGRRAKSSDNVNTHPEGGAYSRHMSPVVGPGQKAQPLPLLRRGDDLTLPNPEQPQAGAFGFVNAQSTLLPPPTSGQQSPFMLFQHIHDTASKRISTLDYLRKAHEGRVYWFNTVLFDKADLSKLPHSEQRKLGRRATNYLLLGYSLPTVLDLHSQTPVDYLRALNGLLVDFESFQSFHSPDGSTSSSLSRARIPQMFKRATHAAGGKGRRGSTATGGASNVDPANASVDPDSATSLASISAGGSDHDVTGGYISSGGVAGGSSSWGKDYAYLLTPSLPFDPDFHETFATLCDVLIDCYAKLMTLLTGPDACGPSVGDWFAKADSRIRKSIVAGFVREFEDASRVGTKSEIAGLNKVILGGLM